MLQSTKTGEMEKNRSDINETGVIFETVYVIQCSRNASNETNIKFSIYLEQNLLRTLFLGSRLSSGGLGCFPPMWLASLS